MSSWKSKQEFDHLGSRLSFNRREYESLKNQVEFVVESLKRLKIDKDLKQYKCLLENLNVVLVSENSSHKKSSRKIEFTNEIQFFSQFLSVDIRLFLSRNDNRLNIELYEVQSLLFKNVLLILKMNSSIKNEMYSTVFETFLDDLILYRKFLIELDSDKHKAIVNNLISLIYQVLKCLSIMTTEYEFQILEISKNSLCAKFIGILRCFTFYGLESFELKSINLHLYPSMIGQIGHEPESNQRKRKQTRKQSENDDVDEDDSLFNISSNLSNSATEYSSSELDDENQFVNFVRNKKIHADIRMICYELLSSSIQIFGIRIVFGFWSFFFPEKFEASSQSKQFSVLWTILKDNSNRVKKEALIFMYDFFNYGKFFVKALVSESKQQSSASKGQRSQPAFTTISQSLTMMIKELHVFFDRIFFLESKSLSLIMLYKVMILVVSITPYNKISSDILHPLFNRNSYLLDHKVTQIKNLSLVLYVKMFTPELLPKEFRNWLTESKAGAEVMNKIFWNCFEFIKNSDHMLLCSESIKLLSSIVKHHGAMIDLFNANLLQFQVLKSLQQISIEMLNSERFYQNSVLQCLVCKFVYTFGMFLKHIPNKNLEKIFDNDEGKLQFITNWFLEVFDSKTFHIALVDPKLNLVQNSSQVTLINVISLIPDEVFIKIDQNFQYRIVSLLMSIANDNNLEDFQAQDTEIITSENSSFSNMRLPAIRCLSILQGLTPLCCDSNLIVDIIQICLDVLNRIVKPSGAQKKKKAIFVLEHTLWPLANVLDGVKKRRLEDEIELALLEKTVIALNKIKIIDYHMDDFLVNLARCTALVVYIILVKQGSYNNNNNENDFCNENNNDKDDLNVLQKKQTKIRSEILLESLSNMIHLLSSSKLFKLQWNICISFSYLLELKSFVLLCQSPSSQSDSDMILDKIFYSILKLFQTSENHKVQSYAIFTICSICDLSFFDHKFNHLWPSIVEKFCQDYNSVPLHSKQSWIDKYCFSLERVLKHFILQRSNVLEDEKNLLQKLKIFINEEINEIEFQDLKNFSNFKDALFSIL